MMDLEDAINEVKKLARGKTKPSIEDAFNLGLIKRVDDKFDKKIEQSIIDLIGTHTETARLMATGIPQMFVGWLENEMEVAESSNPAIEATTSLIASMTATLIANIKAAKGESDYDKSKRIATEMMKAAFVSIMDQRKS